MTDDTISQTDWAMVQSYLMGQLTSAEADMALDIIDKDRRLYSLVAALQATAPDGSDPPVDLSALKLRIDAQRRALPATDIDHGSRRIDRMGLYRRPTLRNRVWLAASAALAIVLVLSVWNIGARHVSQLTPAQMMTYTTANGERATITLPDGGNVLLNVASRLEVPMDYMAGNRTVRLVGEGLFTVSHHDGSPLTVVTEGAAVRVLGTSFVVRRYATDTTSLVVVREGKVSVATNGEKSSTHAAVVSANQAIEVGSGGTTLVHPMDESQFSFASGTLTINGVPLPAAIVELNRWYDADIRLGDPALAERYVQGTFGAGSLGDLAEILGTTYDVRVVRVGRVLTLNPKR